MARLPSKSVKRFCVFKLFLPCKSIITNSLRQSVKKYDSFTLIGQERKACKHATHCNSTILRHGKCRDIMVRMLLRNGVRKPKGPRHTGPEKRKANMNIRNGRISVAWFQTNVAVLLRAALDYARKHQEVVEIWSNDYRNFRCKRYAHLECVVLPDGRCDNPHIMKAGGIWCKCAYPDHDKMQPVGKKVAREMFDKAGSTFSDIYQGWETQPD